MNKKPFIFITIGALIGFINWHYNWPTDLCTYVVYIPEWHWSKTKDKYVYGGFTADIGWALMVARYAYFSGVQFTLPTHWGHGGLGTSWRTMFQQTFTHHVDPGCFPRVIKLEAKYDDELRQRVKFKNFYKHGRGESPNPNVQRALGLQNVGRNDDLTTMRAVFKNAFGLTPDTRDIVDSLKPSMYEPYVSMHIRWGDKIGRGVKGDPKESSFVPLDHYIKYVPEWIKTVYVATDDHDSVLQLQALLPNHTIVTAAAPETHSGFSITQYKPDYAKTLQFWSEMEMMADAHVFIGNFQSSVAKTVQLMRHTYGTSFDVMDSFRNRKPWACCDTKYNGNCFWLCIS